MNTVRLSNISIAEFKAFLESKGCIRVDNGNEGHEKWEKPRDYPSDYLSDPY